MLTNRHSLSLSRTVWQGLLLLPLVIACTGIRMVPGTTEPEGVRQFFATHHPADVRIADERGRTIWLHRPQIEGDSLTGLLSREEPRLHGAVALSAIRTLATPHFSAGRTAGLFAGIVGTAGLTVLILASGNDVSY